MFRITHPILPRARAAAAPVPSRRIFIGLAAAAAAVGLLGCATPAVESNDPTALLERARAYWNAIRTNDLVTAWQYEAISRDPNWSLPNYLKRVGGIQYHEVQVRSVKAQQQDRAEVEVYQRFSVPLARLRDQEATIVDRWVRIEGRWYHARD
ncbi:MAG: hypothetical protein AB1371_08580 [Pseudomonadota bacterium]